MCVVLVKLWCKFVWYQRIISLKIYCRRLLSSSCCFFTARYSEKLISLCNLDLSSSFAPSKLCPTGATRRWDTVLQNGQKMFQRKVKPQAGRLKQTNLRPPGGAEIPSQKNDGWHKVLPRVMSFKFSAAHLILSVRKQEDIQWILSVSEAKDVIQSEKLLICAAFTYIRNKETTDFHCSVKLKFAVFGL